MECEKQHNWKAPPPESDSQEMPMPRLDILTGSGDDAHRINGKRPHRGPVAVIRQAWEAHKSRRMARKQRHLHPPRLLPNQWPRARGGSSGRQQVTANNNSNNRGDEHRQAAGNRRDGTGNNDDTRQQARTATAGGTETTGEACSSSSSATQQPAEPEWWLREARRPVWRIEKFIEEGGEGCGGKWVLEVRERYTLLWVAEYVLVGSRWLRETEPRPYWPFDAPGVQGEKDEREHDELVKWMLGTEGPFQHVT